MYKNKNMIIKFLLFISFLLTTRYQLLTPTVAYAAIPRQSLRVSPIINDLKLTPGKPTTVTLTVENISQNPVGIHAEITGNDVLGDAPLDEQKPSAMVDWTSLSTNDLVLGEKEKKVITVTINPPANVGQNGYYE